MIMMMGLFVCLVLDHIYKSYDHDDGIVCLLLDSIYQSYDHDDARDCLSPVRQSTSLMIMMMGLFVLC